MVHRPQEGHAPRSVPERLSELAPPWQLQLLQEAMKGGRLEWEEDAEAGSRSVFSDGGDKRPHIDAWYEPGWALYPWQPPVERRVSPPRGARIATSARRLMAQERRRMRRRSGGDRLDRRGRRIPRLS